MPNAENLNGHGFQQRTASERRELARIAGKKSGEKRRQKAEFKKTLNALLTAHVENDEWEPVLRAMGLECTLEAVVNAKMILEAMHGNVKAYEAIAKYSGQDTRTEEELQRVRMENEKLRAEIELIKKELTQENDKTVEEMRVIMEGEESE